jgi:hypothetical protein
VTSIAVPRGGQGCTQFVCGVGGEQPLAVEDSVPFEDAALDTVEHVVDRARQHGQLVGGRGDRYPFGEVLGGQSPGGGRDRTDRPQHPPGHQPSQYDGQHGHHDECQTGLDQQRGQGVGRHPVREIAQVLCWLGHVRRRALDRVQIGEERPVPQVLTHQQIGQCRQRRSGGQDQGGQQQGQPGSGGQRHPVIR